MDTLQPEVESKPLPAKYDGRALTPRQIAQRERQATERSSRPKIKKMRKSDSAWLLQLLNHKEEWQKIYRDAFEAKDYGLCFQILRYLTDRRDGKPYVASNPSCNNVTRPPDQNLNVAINMLTVDSERPRRRQVVIDQPIQAGKNPEGTKEKL